MPIVSGAFSIQGGVAACDFRAVSQTAFAISGTGTLVGSSALPGAFSIQGTGTLVGAMGVGESGELVNGYTYNAPSAPVGTFDPRHEGTPFTIAQRLGQPSTCQFENLVQIDAGDDLNADLSDGVGSRFHGVSINVAVGIIDGAKPTRHSWVTNAQDYSWLLNRRRPFGFWLTTSISTIISDILTNFTTGFTWSIESNLLVTTVTLDGSQSITDVLTSLMQLAGGAWRLDNKEVFAYTTNPSTNPALIDGSNLDIMYDTSPTLTTDISQVRNRVFGASLAVKVVADALPGADEIQVDGIDYFDPNGGTLISNDQRLTYSGVTVNGVPLTRPASPGTLTAISEWPVLGSLTANTPPTTPPTPNSPRLFYSVAYISGTAGETALSAEVEADVIGFNDTFNVERGEIISGGTGHGIEVGGYNWTIVNFDANGGYTVEAASGIPSNLSINFLGERFHAVNISPASVGVAKRSLVRTQLGGDPNQFFIVIDGFSLGTVTDLYDDTPNALLSGGPYYLGEITNGAAIDITVPIGPAGTTARKIYRRRGDATTPTLLTTLNDNFTTLYVDGASSSSSTTAPGDPAAVNRIFLVGVTGITHTIQQGDPLALWLQLDNTSAQLAMAAREGGDGIREYRVTDTEQYSVLSDVQVRLEAELALFADPIQTVNYATRDRNTYVGADVTFNLTNPPIVGTFKIQTVDIDQIRESRHAAFKERRTVVASSVRFTLDDFLRRAFLRGL